MLYGAQRSFAVVVVGPINNFFVSIFFFEILGKKRTKVQNPKPHVCFCSPQKKVRRKELYTSTKIITHFFYYFLLLLLRLLIRASMTLLVGTIEIIIIEEDEETLSRRSIPCDKTTTSPTFFFSRNTNYRRACRPPPEETTANEARRLNVPQTILWTIFLRFKPSLCSSKRNLHLLPIKSHNSAPSK